MELISHLPCDSKIQTQVSVYAVLLKSRYIKQNRFVYISQKNERSKIKGFKKNLNRTEGRKHNSIDQQPLSIISRFWYIKYLKLRHKQFAQAIINNDALYNAIIYCVTHECAFKRKFFERGSKLINHHLVTQRPYKVSKHTGH